MAARLTEKRRYRHYGGDDDPSHGVDDDGHPRSGELLIEQIVFCPPRPEDLPSSRVYHYDSDGRLVD